jgi:HrpA-like RNA helicase
MRGAGKDWLRSPIPTHPSPHSGREKREEAAAAHARFASRQGDHVTLLTIFRRFAGQPRKQAAAWCREGFLNHRSLSKARDIYAQARPEEGWVIIRQVGVEGTRRMRSQARTGRMQLREHMLGLKFQLSSCGEDTVPLRQSLVKGLFLHAARRQQDGAWAALPGASI